MRSAAANGLDAERVGEGAGVEGAQVGDAVDEVEDDACAPVVVADDEHVARRGGGRGRPSAAAGTRWNAATTRASGATACTSAAMEPCGDTTGRNWRPSFSRPFAMEITALPASWSAWAVAVGNRGVPHGGQDDELGVGGVVVGTGAQAVDPVTPAVAQLVDHVLRPVTLARPEHDLVPGRSPAGPRCPAPPAPSPPTPRSCMPESFAQPACGSPPHAERTCVDRGCQDAPGSSHGRAAAKTVTGAREPSRHVRRPRTHRTPAARPRSHGRRRSRPRTRASSGTTVRDRADSNGSAAVCTGSPGAPASWEQSLLAACLAVPGPVASFRAAAALWHLDGVREGRARDHRPSTPAAAPSLASWSTTSAVYGPAALRRSRDDPGDVGRSHACATSPRSSRRAMVERAVDDALRRKLADPANASSESPPTCEGRGRPAARSPGEILDASRAGLRPRRERAEEPNRSSSCVRAGLPKPTHQHRVRRERPKRPHRPLPTRKP